MTNFLAVVLVTFICVVAAMAVVTCVMEALSD